MDNEILNKDLGQEIISKLKELDSQIDELLNAFRELKNVFISISIQKHQNRNHLFFFNHLFQTPNNFFFSPTKNHFIRKL